MQTCLIQGCKDTIKYIFETNNRTYFCCSCRKHIEKFMNNLNLSFDEKIKVFIRTTHQYRKLEDLTCLTTKYFKDIFNLFPLSKFDYLRLEMCKTRTKLRSLSFCLKKEYHFNKRKQKQHICSVLLDKKSELLYLISILLEEETDNDRLYEYYENINVIDEEISDIFYYFEKYSECLENIQCIRNIYEKQKNHFILEFSCFKLKWTKSLINSVKDCSICLNDLHGEGGHLTCGHFFHNDCMKKWVITNHFSCPNCRAFVDIRKYTYLDKFE